jgi:hypothetical protein
VQGIASAMATCGYLFRPRIKTLFALKEEKAAPLPVAPKEESSANAA